MPYLINRPSQNATFHSAPLVSLDSQAWVDKIMMMMSIENAIATYACHCATCQCVVVFYHRIISIFSLLIHLNFSTLNTDTSPPNLNQKIKIEMSPPRSWDPRAPSLLWAHEIRRENIILTNQLDDMKVSLDSAVATTNALKQSMKELQELVQQLGRENQQLDNRLRESEERASKIESLALQIRGLQDENAALRERLDRFERELTARRGIKGEVLDEMRAMLRLEMDDFRSQTVSDFSLGLY